MKISALLLTLTGLMSPLAFAAAPPTATPAPVTRASAASDCACQGAVPGKVSAPPPVTRTAPAASHADVYGWDIMTPGERRCYELRMLAAKTPAERTRIRDEYHRLMAERAKQQGLTLPEPTPPR